jgi:hypothetical protein
MNNKRPRNWWMEISVKALKYFLLSLVGCTITYFVALILGITVIADLATVFLKHMAVKGAALLSCLFAIAVITESIRY